MRLGVLLSALLLLAVAPVTWAAGSGTSADYVLQAGVTHFYGNLSVDPHAPTLGLAVRRQTPPWSSVLGPISSYWEVAVQGTHTETERRTEFPFYPEAPVSFFDLEFSVNECFVATSIVHPCFGVGANEMTVDGKDNEQNYGAPAVKAELQYGDGPGLTLDATVQYSLVPQIVNKKQTDFSTVSYLLGVGWRVGTTVAQAPSEGSDKGSDKSSDKSK